MSAFDVEEWLGAEVTIKGKVETLPDRVQEALKKGFEDDLWTEADVPGEGTTLDEADMLVRLVLFGAAHEDSCKILKEECYKTDKIRFARLFRAGYGEEVILDATLAPVTVTSEFALDMAAQGMTCSDSNSPLPWAALLRLKRLWARRTAVLPRRWSEPRIRLRRRSTRAGRLREGKEEEEGRADGRGRGRRGGIGIVRF